MCKMKSAIILKDRIFIPDYDGHSDMLKELGIEDTEKNAAMLFVRAELSPKNGDVFTSIDEWIFKVDQDIKPDWFVESYEKERMIQAVKEWAKNRLHIGVDGLEINSGENHYIKDCKNIVICGNARISDVYGSASISEVYGSARISCVCDSASISEVYGNASISRVCGNASISKAKGNAVVANSPYSKWQKQSDLILSENATFKDNIGKVIYQSGDYKLVSVNGGTALKARAEQ